METSEAIDIFIERRDRAEMFINLAAHGKDDYPESARFCDAANMAIASLRERQERENDVPCEFCEGKDGEGFIIHGNKLSLGYGIYREINLCPVCGRPLKGAGR